MTRNKLAIIGGSGLYDVEEFTKRELIDLTTPWGNPSDQILKTIIVALSLNCMVSQQVMEEIPQPNYLVLCKKTHLVSCHSNSSSSSSSSNTISSSSRKIHHLLGEGNLTAASLGITLQLKLQRLLIKIIIKCLLVHQETNLGRKEITDLENIIYNNTLSK